MGDQQQQNGSQKTDSSIMKLTLSLLFAISAPFSAFSATETANEAVHDEKCAPTPSLFDDVPYNILAHDERSLGVVAHHTNNSKVEMIWSEHNNSTDAMMWTWTLREAHDGHFLVVASLDGNDVGILAPREEDGSVHVVEEEDEPHSKHHQWCFVEAEDGMYHITNRGNGLRLSGDTPSGRVLQSASHVEANQKFRLLQFTPPQWFGPIQTPIVNVAAANLPNGKIVLWSGENKNNYGMNSGMTWTSIFTPGGGQGGTFSQAKIQNTKHDMFCPGTAMLGDGRIMITGGSNSKASTIYNPANNQWQWGARMNIPRGYHSITTLGNGQLFTLGGSWSGVKTADKFGEVYDGKKWNVKWGISAKRFLTADPEGQYRSDNHMWLFVAPNGKVFHAGPSKHMHWIKTWGGNGEITYAGPRGGSDAMNGNAVMYDIGKILAVGGAPTYDNKAGKWDAIGGAVTIDINNEKVKVQGTANSMGAGRTFLNSVVLPSGEVVVIGGQKKTQLFSDWNAVKFAEIWSPKTRKFTRLGAMKIARNYHSVAVLMKDGRVFVSGGGLCGTCWGGSQGRKNHFDAEILTPPYLRQGRYRPKIVNINKNVVWKGGNVVVTMRDNQAHTFALVRLGAVTHSVNNDQRRIPLQSSRAGKKFTLQIPGNQNVALTGPYYLFAMDPWGVPSVAESLRINF